MHNQPFMVALAIGLFSTTACAAAPDGALIFATNCASCHGAQGQGTPGLAPALKGNPFVMSGKLEDIEGTIQDGRSGDKKHFKDLPMSMPGWHLPIDDLKAVVEYIRFGLQK